ncbi:MAG: efflux RND transporter permease subunit [Verrucomicrobiae bacterium]|nr:efflux RND transporter permease subunit [Verrucomicrobiae bacterium]
MLEALIRLSLRHRALVLAAALACLALGWQTARHLAIDVLPDLNKPTVTLLTEAPGLAPEEVETWISRPLESAILGLAGLERVRSTSDVGLSLVVAEFSWGTDIYRARQWVQERWQSVARDLPPQARTDMTPVSSLLGEILLVGLSSPDGSVSPEALRTLADWSIRRRLQGIRGVADVLNLGGGVEELQVQPDPHRLAAHGLSLADLERALSQSTLAATSGYLQAGPREVMIRHRTATLDPEALGATWIRTIEDRPVLVRDVATVAWGTQPRRGDASVNGFPGVILSIDKAPGFDTRSLTATVERALEDLRLSLPPGVLVDVLFRQADFIDAALGNVREALRDGAFMVAVVLFLFLFRIRTTVIALVAIPLSFATTLLVFRAFDVGVNAMTLGGLAVAAGMVVDDAIVDVENVFRRLRENAARPSPRPSIEIIARASNEVRQGLLYATLLIILVFLPFLGLEGIEGRLFAPMALATIVSMAASFVVSLTVIPVLCSFLPEALHPRPIPEAPLIRGLKFLFLHACLQPALRRPAWILAFSALAVAGAWSLYPRLGREFLPAFHEGSATVTLACAPGTSLVEASALGEIGTRLLQGIPEIRSIARRTGRAERDDHVMPVSVTEFDIEFHPEGRPRAAVFAAIRRELGRIPGTVVALGQPIGHRLSHMLSGVSARLVVKIFGPDLDTLHALGRQVEEHARRLPGLTDVALEPQVPIPEVRLEVDPNRAAAYGLTPGDLHQRVASLVGGLSLGELRQADRPVPLTLRLPSELRDSTERLSELPVETSTAGWVPLHRLADVREALGPNIVQRENGERRIVLSANPRGRDLAQAAERLEAFLTDAMAWPPGYHARIEGEYAARQAAVLRIVWLSALVAGVMLLLLAGYFRSVPLAVQVLAGLPLAVTGGLVFTWLGPGQLSIASWVGMIAVAGVAARNGILLLSHYLRLMRQEGVPFGPALVVRGTLERLAPVLMTALSAGIALVPLVLAADQPGKEILHPVAVALCGGLVTSTLLGLVATPAAFLLWGRRPAEISVQREAPATD